MGASDGVRGFPSGARGIGPRRIVLIALLVSVALLAALVYLPGLPGEFVYDDHRLIRDNEGLRRPLDVGRAFARDYYASDIDRIGLGYYRPVAILANEFDFRRGGGEPMAFHVTNIALHVGCSLLVFLLAFRLFGARPGAAAAAAGLFALHPAHAESVAFISGRVDPLATFFGLLTVLLHLRANGASRSSGWRVLAGTAWLLAMLSKEMAVTVPLLAMLLETAAEGIPRREQLRHRSLRYVPYLTALLIYLPARWIALGRWVAPSAGGAALSIARPFVVLGSYIAWLVVPPSGLHLEPEPVRGSLGLLAALLLVGVVALAVGLWRWGQRLPAALVSWTVVSLLPVAQLKPLETTLSERFLYLPTAGWCLFVGSVVVLLKSGRRGTGALVLLGALGVGYTAILLPRASIWREGIKLWVAKAQEEPASFKAHLNLAQELVRRGDKEGARRAYGRCMELAPDLALALRGEMETLTGDPQGSDLEAGIRLSLAGSPEDAAVWGNLGWLLLARKDPNGAVEAFTKAVTLTPLRADAWVGLALATMKVGNLDRSADAAQRALALDPTLELARAALAECRVRQGRPCEAVELARLTKLDDPEEAAALGRILAAAEAACARQPR